MLVGNVSKYSSARDWKARGLYRNHIRDQAAKVLSSALGKGVSSSRMISQLKNDYWYGPYAEMVFLWLYFLHERSFPSHFDSWFLVHRLLRHGRSKANDLEIIVSDLVSVTRSLKMPGSWFFEGRATTGSCTGILTPLCCLRKWNCETEVHMYEFQKMKLKFD